MERMNRDKFTNVATARVANGCMSIIDHIQDIPAEVQLSAVAAAFLLACERQSMPAQDVFTIVNNLMNHAEGRRPEFAAVAQYMEEEL